MIVLNLVCQAGHKFEGWFASVDSFEEQASGDLVTCPQCNSSAIERLPVAPHLARKSPGLEPVEQIDEMARFIDMLGKLSEGSEDVGSRFAEEARRMHYREVELRSICGQASLDETRELLEEGIPVLPVPRKPKTH